MRWEVRRLGASTWVSSARRSSGVCLTRTRQPSSRHRVTCCICSTSTLFAHRLDPATITLVGEPMALAEGIASEAGAGLPAIAASSTGTIVYRTGSAGGQRQFIWFDRAGKELSRIGTPEAHGPSYGSISPNRRRLAMQRTGDGNTDIWVLDLERGSSIRFTTDPQADIAPVWSPARRPDRVRLAT